MQPKSILIVGGSGFVGRNLTAAIRARYPSAVISGTYCNDYTYREFARNYGVNSIALDITEPDCTVTKTLNSQWDCVVYLAGNTDPTRSQLDEFYDLDVNVWGLLNFLKGRDRYNRFIYFSSGAVYEGQAGLARKYVPLNPKLPYAINKLAAEQYVKYFASKHKINEYLIVRFFGGFGPYEPSRKITTRIIKAIGNGEDSFTIRGDGSNLIDLMTSYNVARCILDLIGTDKPLNKTVDMCGGNPLTIKDLAISIATCLIEKDDSFEIKTYDLADLAERLYFYGDSNDLKELINFTPVRSFQEEVHNLDAWLFDNEKEEVVL